MKLVGITGKAGAGKDTAAAGLIARGYRKIAFADPIKEAINAITGWNMSQWSDREWKEAIDPQLGVSPRHMATTLGTQWGRYLINPDIWIILSLRKAEGKNSVITDVRFDNEAQQIIDAGGIIIKIERPNNPFPVVNHESEQGVSDHLVDYVIVNEGPIEKMICDVDFCVDTLYEKLIENRESRNV